MRLLKPQMSSTRLLAELNGPPVTRTPTRFACVNRSPGNLSRFFVCHS
jgi:hypothetical protein